MTIILNVGARLLPRAFSEARQSIRISTAATYYCPWLPNQHILCALRWSVHTQRCAGRN